MSTLTTANKKVWKEPRGPKAPVPMKITRSQVLSPNLACILEFHIPLKISICIYVYTPFQPARDIYIYIYTRLSMYTSLTSL